MLEEKKKREVATLQRVQDWACVPDAGEGIILISFVMNFTKHLAHPAPDGIGQQSLVIPMQCPFIMVVGSDTAWKGIPRELFCQLCGLHNTVTAAVCGNPFA